MYINENLRLEYLLCQGPHCDSCNADPCLMAQHKAVLLNNMVVTTSNNIRITIKKGFDFDGMSVPRLLWTSTTAPMEHRTIIAGLVHDALYASQWLTRKEADQILRELLRDCGVTLYTRNKIYFGVRLFGERAWKDCWPTSYKYRELVTVEKLYDEEDAA